MSEKIAVQPRQRDSRIVFCCRWSRRHFHNGTSRGRLDGTCRVPGQAAATPRSHRQRGRRPRRFRLWCIFLAGAPRRRLHHIAHPHWHIDRELLAHGLRHKRRHAECYSGDGDGSGMAPAGQQRRQRPAPRLAGEVRAARRRGWRREFWTRIYGSRNETLATCVTWRRTVGHVTCGRGISQRHALYVALFCNTRHSTVIIHQFYISLI